MEEDIILRKYDDKHYQLGRWANGVWEIKKELGTIYDLLFAADYMVEVQRIRRLTDPNYLNPKSRREARKIMSKHLDRLLVKGEMVHHLDCNPRNNQIGNLHLFPSSSKHNSYHNFLRNLIREEIDRVNSICQS